MNIYIYGNQSFKKEIIETLEHSNIKFKLDGNSYIKEIDSLKELKETIKNNPKDIYLIDDEKIIKKNSLNKKIKFLTPKDAIDEEFLLDSGIADLSINSLKEIPKYILKKYEEDRELEAEKEEKIEIKEEEKKEKIELDDELAMLLAKEEPVENIEYEEKSINDNFEVKKDDDFDDLFGSMDSGVNLDELENLIGTEEKNNSDSDMVDFNDSFGLNNISFDYDDEDIVNNNDDDDILNDKGEKVSDEDFLSNFLDENLEEEKFNEEDYVEEVFEDVNFLDEIFSKKDKEEDIENEDFEEEIEEKFEDFDFSKEDEFEVEKNEPLKGEKMGDDEFFELDSLNEKDLLEALNITNDNSSNSNIVETKSEISKNNNETINVSSSNIDELSLLISKLLNNKTLEITIKLKD
ncbi:hypothetical protein [Arcobacter ellisii]|uniref:Highly acidic protein n=1 Tax=Arcobacter ellisii TaxID=913109 RepID=A0A347U5B4_9BACT|nr:hypothetical protein [Arcobacter ellisii]AXX94042.1 hypothetical protein AELL_0350 [Arcobacter ellisii]RXI32402.1 hypothetical protein CP962_02025 [Arcobacter ellisii]